MSFPAPKLMLVASPAVRDQVADLLAGAGFPAGVSGDGDDATLAEFTRERPAVVVVCADLDAGDPRSLIHAMRDAGGDEVKIVLIGEERGPIRTALDASDFRVDRFVRRPLSAKALIYAVKTCLEPPAPAPPPAAAAGRKSPTRLLTARIRPATAGGPAAEPPVDAPAPREPTLILSGGGAESSPATGVAAEAASSPVPEAAPPPREPTLILSGGGAGAVPQLAPADATERGPSFPMWDEAAAARRVRTEDPVADADLVADLADLDADVNGQPDAVPDDAADTPSGAFGRELRRKMSQMAERLFPNRRRESGLLDVGVAHGHRTEIDLGAIAEPRPAAEVTAFLEEEQATNARVAPGDGPQGRSARDAREDRAEAASPSAVGTQPRASETEEDTTRRTHGSVPLRGQLSDSDDDVATLLGRLFTAGFTGRVSFRDPPAEKVIHFDQGRPVFASSNLPHDRMGDLLFREGKITREQFARSRELVAESGRRMGEILVEMGYLKRRELLPAVRRHVEDVLYSLFAWESGEYQVLPGEFAASERIRLSRHPAALILEGIRRKLGVDHLDKRLGSAAALVAARDRDRLAPVLTSADLTRNERTAITAFDGERTLAEVAGFAEISLLNTYQLAHGLVVLDAAEVLRRGDDDDLAEAVRPPSLVGETDLAIDRQRVLAKHALVAEADYFSLLGVRRDATGFEIRRAYEAARRDYAGDSFPAEVRSDLDAQIDEINAILEEAYRVLQDDRLRASYLANLRD